MTADAGRKTVTLGARGESLVRSNSTSRAELFLVITDPAGLLIDLSFPLDKEHLLVGRGSDADIVLEQGDVSRHHAEILRQDGKWLVRDLGSTNGTFVEGELVEVAHLREDTIVQFGNVAAQVVREGSPTLRRFRRLFSEEHIDPTTDLPNRRIFESELDRVLHYSNPERLAILFVGISSLETINDQFGRNAGDLLLRECARVLAGLRVDGLLCRYDGKFAILKEGATQKEAEKLARILLIALQGAEVNVRPSGRASSAQSPTHLNCGGEGERSEGYFLIGRGSIGIASADPCHGLSGRRVIHTASRALSDAARLGEGQVIVDRLSPSRASVDLGAPQSRKEPRGVEPGYFQVEPIEATSADMFIPQMLLDKRLTVGMAAMAACIDNRRLLEAEHPTEIFKIDRAFREAARQVGSNLEPAPQNGPNLNAESTGVFDKEVLLKSSPSMQVGESPGRDVLVFALRPHIRPSDVATVLEKEFERLRSERELPIAQVICGEPFVVTDGGSGMLQAVANLERRRQTSRRDQRLPLPIAWAHRKLLSQDDPIRAFLHLRDLHQAITRWLFVVLASELFRLRSAGSSDARKTAGLRAVLSKNVTAGTWVAVVRELANLVQDQAREDLVAPELIDALFGRGRRSSVLNDLDAFVKDRNDFAHGGEHRAAEGVARWRPKLGHLLDGPLRCLERLRPHQICDLRFNQRNGDFTIEYRELVGDHLVIAPRITTSPKPKPEGEVALRNERTGGELRLQPLLIYARCPRCELNEVFFLDRLVDNGPVYVSLREGRHEIRSLTEVGGRPEEAAELQAELDELLDQL
jgi:diguanylate cyclase (GGDEF)-like protein